MIETASYQMQVRRGATYDRTMTATIDGDPVDWTGYQAKMTVRRKNKRDAEEILTLSTGVEGGITLGGAAGTIRRQISSAVTDTLPIGTFYYDLKLTSSGGAVDYMVAGAFLVEESVTV